MMEENVFDKKKNTLLKIQGYTPLFPGLPSDQEIKSTSAERFTKIRGRCFFLFGSSNPSILKTIAGWWWNAKTRKGFMTRPLAKDVSNIRSKTEN